jgi:hypothetical protein
LLINLVQRKHLPDYAVKQTAASFSQKGHNSGVCKINMTFFKYENGILISLGKKLISAMKKMKC